MISPLYYRIIATYSSATAYQLPAIYYLSFVVATGGVIRS